MRGDFGGTARAGAAGRGGGRCPPAGCRRRGTGANECAERGSLALTQGYAPGAAFLKLENTPHLPSPPGPSPRPGPVMSAGPRPRRRRAASGRRAPAGTDGPRSPRRATRSSTGHGCRPDPGPPGGPAACGVPAACGSRVPSSGERAARRGREEKKGREGRRGREGGRQGGEKKKRGSLAC